MNAMQVWQRLRLVGLVLALSACAQLPVEVPQPPAAPIAFKETGLWRHATASANVPDAWWQLFDDQVLDGLQAELAIGNENLRSAVAQVANARAALAATRATLSPTLSAGLSATRSAGAVQSDTSVRRAPSNSVALSASASWEIDLWGRLSHGVNAAQASYQASVDDLAAARLSAQATLAQSYFSMRAAEAQQALLERSAVAYRRSLELTQARYDSGVASQTDVLQAQTQLKSAQAQAAEAQIQRQQLEHAIAVLLGKPPSALSIARSATLPAPAAVPELLPATLLERRPDIAAAQRRVAAAYAQIGVADAAFFPALTLSATPGYRNETLAHLVSAPNLFWSIGASLTQTLFDAGARRAASDQARASADQAVATYRQAVLTALQEVEDNLVLADQLHEEAQNQRDALQAAQRNLEITLDQYRAGTVSYLNVVTAQTAALSSESSLIGIRSRELVAVSQLLKNIAGRWQTE